MGYGYDDDVEVENCKKIFSKYLNLTYLFSNSIFHINLIFTFKPIRTNCMSDNQVRRIKPVFCEWPFRSGK